MGARLHGMQKVEGSNPFASTGICCPAHVRMHGRGSFFSRRGVTSAPARRTSRGSARYQPGGRRIRLRNSIRVDGSVWNVPRTEDVVMTEFCFSTPRIIMHRC